MLPDIGHFEEIRIYSGLAADSAEGTFMQQRRARSHNNPVKTVLLDITQNEFLPWIRAHKHIITGYLYATKGSSRFRHLFYIYCGGDVESAVANINSYSSFQTDPASLVTQKF
jgi:hypothetical protein